MRLATVCNTMQNSKLKSQNYISKSGVSLLELIVVLAILAVITGVVVSAFSRFRANSALADSKEKIILALSRARSRTLSSENSKVYGVHFQADRAVLFTGNAYSTSSPTNEMYVFDSRAQISSISITGGGDVIFRRLTGETANIGTVVVQGYSDKILWSTTTISASGIIE